MTLSPFLAQGLNAADFCADHYGLDGARLVGILEGGMFSRPVHVRTDSEEYVLRRHTIRHTPEAFRFQAEAIEGAVQCGVPCAVVKRTSNNAWCVPTPDGSAVYALHRYVEGEVVGWETWRERSLRQRSFLENLGVSTARCHNVLAKIRPGGDPSLAITESPIRFDRLHEIRQHWLTASDTFLSGAHRDDEAAATLWSRFERIENHWSWLQDQLDMEEISKLPQQIVHGDISPVNLVWTDREQPVLIDWDVIHVGWRIYDALGDVLNRTPEGRPDWNRFRVDDVVCYLQGYSTVLETPLSVQERSMVPAMCLARQLEDLRQRVATLPTLDPAKRPLYASLIAMRVEMMDQIRVADFTDIPFFYE